MPEQKFVQDVNTESQRTSREHHRTNSNFKDASQISELIKNQVTLPLSDLSNMGLTHFHRPSSRACTQRDHQQESTPRSIFDEQPDKSECYVDDDEDDSTPTVTVTQHTQRTESSADVPQVLMMTHHQNNHSSQTAQFQTAPNQPSYQENKEEVLESYRQVVTYDERDRYYQEESEAFNSRYGAPCLSSRSGGVKKPMSYLLNEKSYQTSKIVQKTTNGILSQKRKSASKKSLGRDTSQGTMSTTCG